MKDRYGLGIFYLIINHKYQTWFSATKTVHFVVAFAPTSRRIDLRKVMKACGETMQ